MMFFQDLADNPQYSLVVEAGTSSVSYFNTSNSKTNQAATTIWSRTSKIKLLDEFHIEDELLQNAKSVYFGPLLITIIKFKSIPCRVAITSTSIVKVNGLIF